MKQSNLFESVLPVPSKSFDARKEAFKPGDTVYDRSNILTEAEKKERKIKNGSQNEKILQFLQKNCGVRFTAWEIRDALEKASTFMLITSVRRALTTLHEGGYINHHSEKADAVQGRYGKETTWSFEGL